jgi:hypothetical protein
MAKRLQISWTPSKTDQVGFKMKGKVNPNSANPDARLVNDLDFSRENTTVTLPEYYHYFETNLTPYDNEFEEEGEVFTDVYTNDETLIAVTVDEVEEDVTKGQDKSIGGIIYNPIKPKETTKYKKQLKLKFWVPYENVVISVPDDGHSLIEYNGTKDISITIEKVSKEQEILLDYYTDMNGSANRNLSITADWINDEEK